MAMTPKEYDKMLKESSPPTRSGRSLAELKGQNLVLQIDDGPALGVMIVHVEGNGDEAVLNLSPR